MASVSFTSQLQRFTDTPRVQADAATLRLALDAAFALNPRLRGYVLDDQARVRPHVAVFVDGRRVRAGSDLSEPLGESSEVHVLQALSGG